MCGLVGFISAEKGQVGATMRRNFLRQALIIDTLRGHHSTGVMIQNTGHLDKVPGFLKVPGCGSEFVNHPDYAKWVEKHIPTAAYAVGHNRYATMGGVSTDTAHPFVVGDVALCHNGTISNINSGDMPLPMKSLADVVVDSHALTHNIAHVSPTDVGKVTSNIIGGSAIVWSDARDKTINFARNTGRPLHMGIVGNTLFFMSEAEQLWFLNKRLGMGIKELYALDVDTHLKFEEGSLKPRMMKLDVGKERPAYTYGGGYYAGDNGYDASGWGRARVRPARQKTPAERRAEDDEQTRLYLDGRMREPAKIATASLKRVRLTPFDRLKFKVMRTHQVGHRAVIFGRLVGMGRRAVIHTYATTAKKGDEWSVRPTAVYSGRRGLVVCTMHSMKPDEGDFYRRMDKSVAPKSKYGTSPRTFDGPEGDKLTYGKWHQLTEGGCLVCQRSLTEQDADELMWYEDQPVCKDCNVEMEEEHSAAVDGAEFNEMRGAQP